MRRDEFGKKLMLIVNPVAGRRLAQKKLADFVRIFMEHGYMVTTFLTRKSGDATELAKKYAAGYDRLVCVGGDGTLSETVAGLILGNIKTPLGYIPAGSSNDFAGSHGISGTFPFLAENAIVAEEKPVDAGLFNGRPFLYIAAFGAFSGLSYSTPQDMKNTLGHSAYIFDAVRQLQNVKAQHMRVTIDGKSYEGDYIFGAVSNVLSISGVLQLPREAVKTDDGRFEVVLVKEPGNLTEWQEVIDSILTGDYWSDLITFAQAKTVSIEAREPIDWSLDGEYANNGNSVQIEILKNAVSVAMKA